MLIRHAPDLRDCDVTDKKLYLRRREFLAAGAGSAAGLVSPLGAAPAQAAGLSYKPGPFKAADALTPKEDVTSYNNFYEFGTDKSDPARNAGTLKPRPWTITVDGLCDGGGR